jgi:HEAT repeat protein
LVPAVLLLWCFASVCFANVCFAQAPAPKSEKDLLAILRSDAPEAQKAITCKELSIVGTGESAAELAKLLSNERLSSWARIALEAIPGQEVDGALRKAAESLEGRQLVGVINSIGIRGDKQATGLLAKRLGDANADVASAAAVALGHIGGAEAAGPLKQELAGAPATVRSAIAEGLVLCAEQFAASGNSAEAVSIFDQVRKAEVPHQRMLEATRGAILARGNDGIPLLLEQLRSSDKGLFYIGLGTAREFPGSEIDKALAAELDRATPERAALVITAMADRPKTVDREAIVKAASRGAKPVRLAAIEALGRVGNGTVLEPLLAVAREADPELKEAAKEALVALPGDSINTEIAERVSAAGANVDPLLLEVVGERRIDAVPALIKALDNPNRAVRSAALAALGSTVPDKYLSVLIAQVVNQKDSELQPAAQAALKEAAARMPDREACAAQIATAMNTAPAPIKSVLLETLAAVGGTKAVQTIGAAAKSSDATLQDVSTRVLGEWLTLDAAPVLLDLSKTPGKYQGRALRGYLRLARQFASSDQQRAEMCASALEAARQPADQKLVIDVMRRYPSLDMLRLAVKAADIPALKEDAKSAAVTIADKLPKTDETRQLLSKVGAGK